jgi:hypothetical protein
VLHRRPVPQTSTEAVSVMNVKAAIMVCLGCIGGAWGVVERQGLPQVEVRSPIVIGGEYPGMTRVAGLEIDRRTEAARQFTRPNAMDVQAGMNQVFAGAVAFRPPATEAPIEPALPPLVYDPRNDFADLAEANGVGEPSAVLAAVPEAIAPAVSDVPVVEAKRYRVAKHDTLGRIAKREWNSEDPRLVELLLAANPPVQARKGCILIGEEIVIPQRRNGASAAPAVAATAAPEPAATVEERWYTIQRSDTLASIAKRLLNDERRWREIVSLNRVLDPQKIVPGMRIKLPPLLRLAQG